MAACKQECRRSGGGGTKAAARLPALCTLRISGAPTTGLAAAWRRPLGAFGRARSRCHSNAAQYSGGAFKCHIACTGSAPHLLLCQGLSIPLSLRLLQCAALRGQGQAGQGQQRQQGGGSGGRATHGSNGVSVVRLQGKGREGRVCRTLMCSSPRLHVQCLPVTAGPAVTDARPPSQPPGNRNRWGGGAGGARRRPPPWASPAGFPAPLAQRKRAGAGGRAHQEDWVLGGQVVLQGRWWAGVVWQGLTAVMQGGCCSSDAPGPIKNKEEQGHCKLV